MLVEVAIVLERLPLQITSTPTTEQLQKTIVEDYYCARCERRFVDKTWLQRHLLFDHETIRTAKFFEDSTCARCEKSFPTKNHLVQHLRLNHQIYEDNKSNTYNYKCSACGKDFPTFTRFNSHWLIHQPPKRTCNECPAKFRHQCDLRKHLLRRHNKVVKSVAKSFDCDQCGKVFQAAHQLSYHLAYHKSPQFNCIKCGKIYFHLQGLQCHTRHAHRKRKAVGKEGKIVDFSCPICHKHYATAITLQSHAALHKPQQFKCSVCEAQFYRHCDLDRHQITTHCIEVDKRTKCEVCGKQLRSPQGLSLHKRFHSSPTVSCSRCDQTFYTQGSLTRHVQTAHTTVFPMPTSAKGNLFCAVCCRPYYDKTNLKTHLLIHYPHRKLLQCHICQRIFHSNGSLLNHLRAIHNH